VPPHAESLITRHGPWEVVNHFGLDPSMAQPQHGTLCSLESNNYSRDNESCSASAMGGELETFGLSVSSGPWVAPLL